MSLPRGVLCGDVQRAPFRIPLTGDEIDLWFALAIASRGASERGAAPASIAIPFGAPIAPHGWAYSATGPDGRTGLLISFAPACAGGRETV